MRLAWEEFTPWVEKNAPERSWMIKSFLEDVKDMTSDLNQEKMTNLLQSPHSAELITLWTDYLEHLRHNNGELSAFWMSYIDMVEDVVLGLLRASREGDWELHLHAIRTMIPWCFAYDKMNYARYIPYAFLYVCILCINSICKDCYPKY